MIPGTVYIWWWGLRESSIRRMNSSVSFLVSEEVNEPPIFPLFLNLPRLRR